MRKPYLQWIHRLYQTILTLPHTIMNDALLSYVRRRHLDEDYISNKCKLSSNSFSVPLRNFDWRSWRQERKVDPKEWELKSRTEYGSGWHYFLNWRDKEKDILIVEWEIDFLSILPFATNYNVVWLKWINNLTHCIKDIEKLQKIYDVYILVDNDFPAEESIKRIPYTPLHLYDVRGALCWCKDVNDAICQGCLDMSVLPKRIVKLKPQPRKKFTRNDTLDTLAKIDNIPVMDVLESLYPEYHRRWQDSITDGGKETHGYKFSNRLNIVRDFSWKGRPEGGPYQIAKSKFGDAKLTFLYFKWKI